MATTFKVYAVYDQAVSAYLPPIFMRAHGEAIRSFERTISDKQHDFFHNAKDFSLHHIADWEDASAKFTLLDVPICLVTALEVVSRLNQPGAASL